MTVKELSQLFYLRGECRFEAEQLADIDRQLVTASEKIRPGLEKLRGIIAAKHRRIFLERDRLERFINEIDDPYIQRLFAARFVEGKNWPRIAMDLGGYAGEDGLKKNVYRYLEKYNANEK